MLRRPRDNRLLAALLVNAALVAAVCVELAPRAAAVSATQLSTESGELSSGDLMVMPAQLSPNMWGCYVLDKARRSLTVYQYSPGERLLRLLAGRDVRYDARLADFNTQPSPSEIKDLLDRAASGSSGVELPVRKDR